MIELAVALVGAVASILVAVLVARWEGRNQAERLRVEAALHAERLAAELRTEFMAEEAIRMLLQHPKWTQRSFGAIKRRIRGFSDQDLRVLLVRSGAVAFGGERDTEWWGLRERNMDRLADLADADDADTGAPQP